MYNEKGAHKLNVNVQKRLGTTLIKVAFEVPEEGITVLYGHSGAGKTSVINMLSGLITPDSGTISLNGKVLFDSATKINIPTHKRRAGYIFQDKRLFPFMSVRKNLLFGCRNKKNDKMVLTNIAELLGIADLLDRKPDSLSGGEGQRVAIGRALLSQPEYLLMDEPLSSLDQQRKNELIPYIKQIPDKFNVPVILVTHSYEEAAYLADHIVLLDGGEVTCNGTSEQILPQISCQSPLSFAV
ncbi:molybdenum ABC transporter, ATP-binding protein [Desulfuromusa kysingii]|uniref:Molybdenum ABC transporter, ATP-binding protein n=1 Tax=Desulfuromusa kysingii TaxID=37625 RepID=A0A1H3X3T2_9BACT|nr:molybdenum ABC transporter ATP-binding protein [Desulfuromusa kysingii]SDZ94046.1 molybdenum ABC transporter, ATP-binding protein [Desulfuromusa kysingii]